MWRDRPDPQQELLPDIDRALVHALQIDPRAPWSRIAQVLGVDAATVARRWAAIAEAGTAWFTVWAAPERRSTPTDAALVVVEGAVSEEVETLWCALPWVLGVERTSVGLVAFVVGHSGTQELDARIRSVFVRPGLEMKVEYASHIAREDSAWRLGALTPAQAAQVAGPVSASVERARPTREEVVDEVVALLRENARMSLGTLAARLGVSDATARRTVERLVGQGAVRVGCDVAMPAVGLRRGVVLRLADWDEEGPAGLVLADPSVHRVLQTVGPSRATVSLRLTSLTDLRAAEQRWRGVRVVDRWTVTRTLKRNGHRIGADGRSTGHVDVEW